MFLRGASTFMLLLIPFKSVYAANHEHEAFLIAGLYLGVMCVAVFTAWYAEIRNSARSKGYQRKVKS